MYTYFLSVDSFEKTKQHQNNCIFILTPVNVEIEGIIINVINWLKDKLALFKIKFN